MKNLLYIFSGFLIIILASVSHCEEVDKTDRMCIVISKITGDIMKNGQENVPKEILLQLRRDYEIHECSANTACLQNNEIQQIIQIIHKAYKEPKYN